MAKLLSPVTLGGLELKNPVIMPPMCMYEVKKEDGLPTPFHFAHYGSRAISGLGLIIQEATAVNPHGRLTKHDLGLWNDQQGEALRPLVDSVHYLGAKIGVQLVHAGRKAADESQPKGASAIEFGAPYQKPSPMSTQEVKETIEEFVQAAIRAEKAGYDMVEIHAAHGYLLDQFLEAVTNNRTDQYGGSLAGRYQMLREIIDGIKARTKLPVWVRISANVYDESGLQNTMEDWKQIACWLEDQGVACIDVSTGGLLPSPPNIPVHAGFQVPYAAALKEAVSISIVTVGLISDPGHAEYILQNKLADGICLGRVLLRNPNWLNDAAKVLRDRNWKVFNESYERGQA